MNVYLLLSSSAKLSARKLNCGSRLHLLFAAGTVAVVLSTTVAQSVHSGPKAISPTSGNRENGEAVFTSRGCSKCHGSHGEGVSASGSDNRMGSLAFTSIPLPTFIELVRKPKDQMPPFDSHQVSDSELTDVYAFLHSSTTTVEHSTPVARDAKNGQRLFVLYGCSECHLSKGQGSRATGGRIGPPDIPLSAFTSYVREPTGEMPPYTKKTVTDAELADMYAFLQSVPRPPAWKTIPLLSQ